ncbi:MAG: hypothetical protein FJ303_13160 [Planctomycetes bacterium]|nr:hypothetical protein [Planctomycetota bacterium]
MVRTLLTLFMLGLPCALVHAAEPTIRALDIRGVRIGGATTLTIDGDDLGKTPRLLLPFAVKQALRPGNTDKKAVFDVFTLTGDVEPGYYHLRVVTEGGVSLPVVIGVDELMQQTTTAPVTTLPVAIHATVAGSSTVEAKFAGKAKQKVTVEIEAQRFGSKLRPIVHLYNAQKRQLAWAWSTPSLYGDCRIQATLPQDGEYLVTVHDAEYAAPAPSFYRLRIGEWSYADQVFPPAVSKESPTFVELIGSPAKPASAAYAQRKSGATPILWPKAGLRSGPRPFVHVNAYPEIVEQSAKDKPQDLPQGVVAISGKLLTANEEDRYRIAVKPLSKVRLEVFAERLGSPIDAALVVRNEKGDQLSRAEDSPGTLDPVLEYGVPDKVTSIIVGVVDAQGRGGPRGIYRLVVEPLGAARDYKLTTNLQRALLPVGGRAVVPVFVERRGFLGKIDLSPSLPSGIKANGLTIPEGADGTLVVLERSESLFDALITQWRGKSADGEERTVAIKGHPMERVQPWLAEEIALAPSAARAEDFVIDWANLPTDVALIPGSKLVLPIKTARANPKTSVKLTLLTSQVTPIVNNQPDANKALRQEKAVELPMSKNDGEVVVLTPPELSAPSYDVTVQAELLDAGKKTLAVAYAPVRRMAVRLPLVVKLDGPTRIETLLHAKTGATIKLAGKVERIPGVKADVAIALTGLPAGAKADPVTVKAEASDFVVNVSLPPTVPAGDIKGIKLFGSFAPEPKTPAVRVKSREVEIEFVVKAAAK